MSTTVPPKPLTFSKHALIIAALAAAGQFMTSLVVQEAVPPTIGAAIGALIGEALVYEHSA